MAVVIKIIIKCRETIKLPQPVEVIASGNAQDKKCLSKSISTRNQYS